MSPAERVEMAADNGRGMGTGGAGGHGTLLRLRGPPALQKAGTFAP